MISCINGMKNEDEINTPYLRQAFIISDLFFTYVVIRKQQARLPKSLEKISRH